MNKYTVVSVDRGSFKIHQVTAFTSFGAKQKISGPTERMTAREIEELKLREKKRF